MDDELLSDMRLISEMRDGCEAHVAIASTTDKDLVLITRYTCGREPFNLWSTFARYKRRLKMYLVGVKESIPMAWRADELHKTPRLTDSKSRH